MNCLFSVSRVTNLGEASSHCPLPPASLLAPINLLQITGRHEHFRDSIFWKFGEMVLGFELDDELYLSVCAGDSATASNNLSARLSQLLRSEFILT